MAKQPKISIESDGEGPVNSSATPQGSIVLDNDANPMAAVLRATLAAKSEEDTYVAHEKADAAVDAKEGMEALYHTVESLVQSGGWNHATQEVTRIAMEGFLHAAECADAAEAVAASHALAGGVVEGQVALESIGDILQVMSNHVEAGFGKLKNRLLSALGNLSASMPHLEDSWRKMERRLHNTAMDAKPKKDERNKLIVDARPLVRRFHERGRWPSNIGGYLTEYASFVEELALGFDHEAQASIVHNSDLLAQIDFTSAATFDSTLQHAQSSWKDPRKELNGRIFDFATPGGPPFFINVSQTYNGENKAIRFFDEYASKHVPANGRWGLTVRKVENKEEVEPLSLQEMRELCKHFLDVTERIKLEQQMHGEALAHARVKAEFFGDRREKADKDVKQATREAYKYLDKAYGVTYELGEYKYQVLSQFVSVSKALLSYMEKSLKPHETDHRVDEFREKYHSNPTGYHRTDQLKRG